MKLDKRARWAIAAVGGFLGLGALLGKRAKRRQKFEAVRYVPGSPEQEALFGRAAMEAQVPQEWARGSALRKLLQKESGGWVGIPNFTYGERSKDRSMWPEVWAEIREGIRTTKSTATGLGQLNAPNVDKHYPDGRRGIGDAYNEAVGMLRYIKTRYGSPTEALAFHNEKGWY